MGIHDGHRKRMLGKFSKTGFAGLEEHEKLEIILFFSVPRINTNDIAHELLNKYKTIAAVMDAPRKELIEFKGITDRTVQLFKMIKEASSLYDLENNNVKTFMTTTEEFGTYLQLYYGAIEEETLTLLSLDSRGMKKDIDVIGEGNISTISANPRELLRIAIERKATEVVICHNHPGGIAEPSEADVMATVKIIELLKTIGVHLIDHIIVTKGDYYSMAASPEHHHIFKDK
ncbi:MAG: hypothetical protein E7568_03750 [Ruminococcaceae bacterium]|nr:hypothetical protein [Oscillospiraceae bacterium]